MKVWIIAFLAAAVTGHAWAASDYFRWIDEKGRVVYSDQIPPPNARNVQILKRSGTKVDLNAPGAAAKGQAEVVLFTAACGATCDEARGFLAKRGIPFSLKDAQNNVSAAEELKSRTGSLEVPVLIVGDAMQRGFSPTVWEKMLEVGGHKPPAKEPAKEGEGSSNQPLP